MKEKSWKGMVPKTESRLKRAINISIGVSDAGLESAFGVAMQDGFDTVDIRAAKFCRVVGKYLHS